MRSTTPIDFRLNQLQRDHNPSNCGAEAGAMRSKRPPYIYKLSTCFTIHYVSVIFSSLTRPLILLGSPNRSLQIYLLYIVINSRLFNNNYYY